MYYTSIHTCTNARKRNSFLKEESNSTCIIPIIPVMPFILIIPNAKENKTKEKKMQAMQIIVN